MKAVEIEPCRPNDSLGIADANLTRDWKSFNTWSHRWVTSRYHKSRYGIYNIRYNFITVLAFVASFLSISRLVLSCVMIAIVPLSTPRFLWSPCLTDSSIQAWGYLYFSAGWTAWRASCNLPSYWQLGEVGVGCEESVKKALISDIVCQLFLDRLQLPLRATFLCSSIIWAISDRELTDAATDSGQIPEKPIHWWHQKRAISVAKRDWGEILERSPWMNILASRLKKLFSYLQARLETFSADSLQIAYKGEDGIDNDFATCNTRSHPKRRTAESLPCQMSTFQNDVIS